MSYLRWSNSPFYVFEHEQGIERGEPLLAIYVHEKVGLYTVENVRQLHEALELFLEDCETDLEGETG